MDQLKTSALVWLIELTAATAAVAGAVASPSAVPPPPIVAAERDPLDRIETLDWSDPERAVMALDALPLSTNGRARDVQRLEVQGMVYADVRRDADVDATIDRLNAMARQGVKSALGAEHYVRAYALYERDQYAAASAELSQVDI